MANPARKGRGCEPPMWFAPAALAGRVRQLSLYFSTAMPRPTTAATTTPPTTTPRMSVR